MAKKGSFVKFSSVISLLIVLAVLFASCGSANGMKGDAYYDNSGSQIEYDMPSEAEKSDDYYSKLEISSGEAVDPELSENGENPLEGRKIIKTVNVVSETKELDSVLARIESEVSALGGYIQSSNVYGKSYEKYSDRHANYTLRIPAEKLDGFMNSMSGLVNITSKTEKVDDITDSYADAEARLTTLKTEETRLLELLAKAEKLVAESNADDIPAEILALAEERKEARKAKDFAKADALRDKIADMGYIIEETRQGTKISKK